MIDRKEKEAEFFAQHREVFSKLKLHDPFFTIKTAFYMKGKQGRFSQFFEWELSKDTDVFIEFYDYADKNGERDMVPMLPERRLFFLKNNPFFKEEYETKEVVKHTGESYNTFLVPLEEMLVVLSDGSMISYHDFESGNFVDPQEQMTLTDFPDFEKELKPNEDFSLGIPTPNVLGQKLMEMEITDFAAILWKKPVSSKSWLNDLITKTFADGN